MDYFEQYYITRKSQIMTELYDLINETERYRFKELTAAVKIEALWRMYKQRKYYLHQQWAVRIIKRVFRGYRTRKNFWKLTNIALSNQRIEFFSSCIDLCRNESKV